MDDKRRVTQYLPETKAIAIQMVEEGASRVSVSRYFTVPESTLRGWLKDTRNRTLTSNNSSTSDSEVHSPASSSGADPSTDKQHATPANVAVVDYCNNRGALLQIGAQTGNRPLMRCLTQLESVDVKLLHALSPSRQTAGLQYAKSSARITPNRPIDSSCGALDLRVTSAKERQQQQPQPNSANLVNVNDKENIY